MKQPGGFSFVEVMIVVTILAIVGALAAPMFASHDADRLRAAARLLIADIGYAQVESMSHSDDPRLIVFQNDALPHGYHLAAASAPDTPLINPIGKVPYVVAFGAGRAAEMADVRIIAVSVGGDHQLQFGLYGQLDQTTPAAITLGRGQKRIVLSVDPISGEASVGQVTTE